MLAGDPLELLRDRIRGLERPMQTWAGGPPDSDELWRHAVWEMASYTNTAFGRSPEELIIEPDEADAVAAKSVLLRRLSELRGGVIGAPIDSNNQEWISAKARPGAGGTKPSHEFFREAAYVADWRLPQFGFYTSTTLETSHGSLWRLYLDQNSSLYPHPWYRWNVPVSADARVAEIDAAVRWAEFVEVHHRRVARHLYVDWQGAAEEFAGIHLSLAAVVAVQSFSFPTSAGVTAPAFWDVEQTLWLDWSFAESELIDRIVCD